MTFRLPRGATLARATTPTMASPTIAVTTLTMASMTRLVLRHFFSLCTDGFCLVSQRSLGEILGGAVFVQ